MVEKEKNFLDGVYTPPFATIPHKSPEEISPHPQKKRKRKTAGKENVTPNREKNTTTPKKKKYNYKGMIRYIRSHMHTSYIVRMPFSISETNGKIITIPPRPEPITIWSPSSSPSPF